MTAHIALVATGGALDLVGIVLVAAPELSPRARRAYLRVEQMSRRIRYRVRRLLGRAPRGAVYEDSGAATMHMTGSGVEVVSVAATASVERKLDFLITQSEELQQRLGVAENRLRDLPDVWRGELRQLRAEIDGLIASELERVRETHIGIRLTGIVCLLVGSSLISIAGLV